MLRLHGRTGRLGAAAAATLVGFIGAHGAPATSLAGAYVSLGAGVNLRQDSRQSASAGLAVPADSAFQFDPGLAAQFGLGWAFGNGLRLDFDVPFQLNQVRGVSGYTPAHRAGGTEVKYGGMVNLMYDFNLGLAVVPYLGVGAGGVEIEHDGFNQSAAGFNFPHPATGGQVGGDFAYQGIVGVSYPVPAVPGLAMTAEYRFLGTLDPGPGYRTTEYNPAGQAVATGTSHFSNDLNHSLMVGLRYSLFQPRAVAAGAEPEAPPTVPPTAATRTYLVFFDWDRADLSARARQIIAEAATASAQVQTTRIGVNGYTDASGSEAYNRRLSVRRAEAVAAELVRDGVSSDDIVMQGFGESHPLVPTARGVREPQNRRVEIILQ